MITFLSLLLVASFAEEHYADPEEHRTHMDPAEGLAVVFYSKQFRFTKIADPGTDNQRVYADTADASPRNLFLLDKDQGEYFIRDAHSNRRLGCAENTNIYAVPSSSKIWPDQLWTFRGPDSEGFYEIVNVHRPKWQIGVISDSKVGCWDTTWSDGKYWKWRLEDIFKADAMWKSIAELDNISDVDGTYQYKKTVGYTQSITKSEAKKSTISESLEFSASGALKGLNLGASSTTTMTQEFSSSVSNAMSGTFTTTETLTWKVPAGKCLQIMQLQVMQDDTMQDIQNMAFYSSKTKIQNCPGHGERAVGVYYNSVSEEEQQAVGWYMEHAECDVQTKAECLAAACRWTGAYCESHGENERAVGCPKLPCRMMQYTCRLKKDSNGCPICSCAGYAETEMAVSGGSNGIPSDTTYYFANWNKNSCAWATGVQVMDEKQCLNGINSLGWGISKLYWTGSSPNTPKGCSFDPKSKHGHFNTHATGHGRQDLRPVCLSKTYDDKCGCMYAYCEDKYGLGKTNDCCEFYRGSSECKQMNSIAVAGEISSTNPVIYSFAALGLGFIFYGAAKHYLGAKPEEERTPFDL